MRTFDALEHGVYRALIDPSGLAINTAAWSRAHGSGEFVGTCRVCGGNLLALPTRTNGNTNWYSAQCVEADCRHEITMPNGAILRLSARHDEMPAGFWAKKTGKA
jgi:hypothetical protein